MAQKLTNRCLTPTSEKGKGEGGSGMVKKRLSLAVQCQGNRRME